MHFSINQIAADGFIGSVPMVRFHCGERRTDVFYGKALPGTQPPWAMNLQVFEHCMHTRLLSESF
jgi:hypothetical protein